MERFRITPSIYIFFIKDGCLLLGRRCNTGWSDGCYGVPAGHLQGNERARDGACREAMEEVGLRVAREELAFACVGHRIGTDERIDLFFSAKNWDGEPTIREPHLCDDLKWFPVDSLPDTMIAHERSAFELYQKGIPYSEFGWE
jgi:ADP-ribose pyrophosphatase YjhB (NUDIX family)